MPHLTIQYAPARLEKKIGQLCETLADEIAACGIFPLPGIRVRACLQDIFIIADRHEKNAFVDMIFRIGAGRSDDEKRITGERLMAQAETFFASELLSGHFMLSLEIKEIDNNFSWKSNKMHERINGQLQ